MPLYTDCQNHFPPGTIATIEVLGDAMRRDDDLIREILLEMEADPEPVKIYPLTLNADAERRRVYHHVMLLVDAGFVAPTGTGYPPQVFRVTNAGHDFLAAIRDDDIWSKMKVASARAGGFGLGLMRDIGVGYLRTRLVEMGVPLG